VQGIYDLRDKGVFGYGCDFINGTESFLPGVLVANTPSPRIQPLFLPDGFERFEAEAIVMSCPFTIESGDRIEFQAVVIYIFKWLG